MTVYFLRGKNLSVFLLALAAVAAAGTLGSWTYALALHFQVRKALRIAEAPAVETAAEPSAMPDPAKPESGQESKPQPLPEKPSAMELERQKALEWVGDKHLYGVERNSVIVTAIAGESALVNGKWIKLGEERDGVKLVELGQNKAVVMLNGENRDVLLWTPMPGTEGRPPSKVPTITEDPDNRTRGGFGRSRGSGMERSGRSEAMDRNRSQSGRPSSDSGSQAEKDQRRRERREEWKSKRDENQDSGRRQGRQGRQ